MMVKHFLKLLLILSIWSCVPSKNIAQDVEDSSDCVMLCGVTRLNEDGHYAYVKYTGTDFNHPLVRKIKKTLVPEFTRREKRYATKNCLSLNPEDCAVWCGVTIPEQKIEYYTVTDTSALKEYTIEKVAIDNNNKENTINDYIKIVCKKDQTVELIQKIETALVAKNYTIVPSGKKYLSKTGLQALLDFQKVNNIPTCGTINYPTLEKLGVE